jgi:heme/copper-type cytochrome/quinol oxidase subunit 1
MAFPRLQALAFWGYFFAADLMIASFVVGDGPPEVDLFATNVGTQIVQSIGSEAKRGTDMLMGSLMVITVVALLSAINVVATVLTQRQAGLDMEDVRPFTWAAFVTSAFSIVTLPVFFAGLFLTYIDGHFGSSLLTSPGGDTVWTHMVSVVCRPDAALMLLPVLGVCSEIVSRIAGRPLIGGVASKFLMAAFGALSLLAWAANADALDSVIQPTSHWFHGLVLIPAALLALIWLGTLSKGVKPDPSLLFVVGAIVVIVLAAANVIVAAAKGVSAEHAGVWQLGQVRTLLISVPLIGLLGGVVELAPIAFGRKLAQPLTGLAALAALGGGALSLLAVAGLSYQDNFDKPAGFLSIVGLVGGMLLAGAVAITLLNVIGASAGKGQLVDAHGNAAAQGELA